MFLPMRRPFESGKTTEQHDNEGLHRLLILISLPMPTRLQRTPPDAEQLQEQGRKARRQQRDGAFLIEYATMQDAPAKEIHDARAELQQPPQKTTRPELGTGILGAPSTRIARDTIDGEF